jgi:hypothetical protein
MLVSTCILVFVLLSDPSMLVVLHPANIKLDFASIDSIQRLCKSKLYPTTGRLVNGNSNMVCKKFEDTGKVVQTRAYEYDYEAWVYISR